MKAIKLNCLRKVLFTKIPSQHPNIANTRRAVVGTSFKFPTILPLLFPLRFPPVLSFCFFVSFSRRFLFLARDRRLCWALPLFLAIHTLLSHRNLPIKFSGLIWSYQLTDKPLSKLICQSLFHGKTVFHTAMKKICVDRFIKGLCMLKLIGFLMTRLKRNSHNCKWKETTATLYSRFNKSAILVLTCKAFTKRYANGRKLSHRVWEAVSNSYNT